MELPWPTRCEKDGTFDAQTYMDDVDRGLTALFDLTDPRRLDIDAVERAVQKFVADWSGPTFEQAIFVGGCVRILPTLLESQSIDRGRAEELAAACATLLEIVERGINPRRVENLRGALADYLGLSMVMANKASGSGMDWQEAQDKAEEIRLRGEPFTSYRKMAKTIGCNWSVLHDAIYKHGTAELQEWASKQRGPSRLNATPEVSAVAFENTPQGGEPDPADITEDGDVDAAMAYLLDQAGPDERAQINALTPAERRQLAKTVYRDPDQEEQALRHRRAAKARRS